MGDDEVTEVPDITTTPALISTVEPTLVKLHIRATRVATVVGVWPTADSIDTPNVDPP
jgi:hypothetical protein